MSCNRPLLVHKRPSPEFPDGQPVYAPCGKCPECLRAKRLAWAYRVQKEILSHHPKPSWFFTLTYDDDSVPLSEQGVKTLCKADFQKFMKLLRKWLWIDYHKRVRYFVVGEYGPRTARPHYHGFLFGIDITEKQIDKYFRKFWKLGVNIDVSPCDTNASVYAVKDMIAVQDHPEGAEDLFYLKSTRPGIGGLFNPPVRTLDPHDPRRLTERVPGGKDVLIPRYLIERWYDVFDLKRIKRNAERLHADDPNLYERSLAATLQDPDDLAQFLRIERIQMKRMKDKLIREDGL